MQRLRGALAASVIGVMGVVVSAAAAPAWADRDAPPPPAAPAPDDTGDNPKLITPQHKEAAVANAGHLHQIGLGLQLAIGMRAINPYQDSTYCGAVGDNGNTNQAYCLSRTPMTLDFELTYGVRPTIEALLELRVGVERDFGATPTAGGGPRVQQWAPGARFFFSESGRSKFFSTAQAVFDTSGYQDGGGSDRGFDFGVRNVNGFWFDVQKEYGFYVFFGEEAGFKRWLSASLEAGLGVQGRYP